MTPSGGPGDRAEPPGAQVMVEKGDRDMLYRGEPSTRNRVRAEVTCAAQQQEELRSAGGTEELQRVLRRVDAIRGPLGGEERRGVRHEPDVPAELGAGQDHAGPHPAVVPGAPVRRGEPSTCGS